MVVVIEQNSKNKIELTKEELKNLLKEAEDEGYARGFKDGSYNSYNKLFINDKTWQPYYEVTCNTEYTGDIVKGTTTKAQTEGDVNA